MTQLLILTAWSSNCKYYGPLRFKILYTSRLPQVLLALTPAYSQSTDLAPSPQCPTRLYAIAPLTHF
jgi:hypothetical protein